MGLSWFMSQHAMKRRGFAVDGQSQFTIVTDGGPVGIRLRRGRLV